MTANTSFAKTHIDQVRQRRLLEFFDSHFKNPDPELIAGELIKFLQRYPLALDEFPRQEGGYTRTVILRHESGFEAMIARWSRGTTSSIHGHPWFNLYCVVHGHLVMDDYQKSGEAIHFVSSGELRPVDLSYFIGEKGRFDNNIHQVHAREETLSIHISSDDSTKSEVFS